ncbi:MAG: hypothetical protein RIT31_753, partial [Actinomycetota bacterium]
MRKFGLVSALSVGVVAVTYFLPYGTWA